MFRRRSLAFLVFFSMVATVLPFARPAAAASADIVISQVYGGGGNAGATYTNDFIELFNRGTSVVNIGGWSVQYASTAGTTWQRTNLSGWIGPGRYFLVQEAAGSGGTTPLPTPHAVGTIPMALGAGKVALVSNQTTLTGSGCPFAAVIVDFVGYGTTTNCSETSPTPLLSNTTAAIRKSAGTQDTDNNNADFTVGPPTPRATSDYQASVTATLPASGSGGVATNADITITFSEPVDVVQPWYSISCTVSGAHVATVSGGPTSYTLDPNSDFFVGERCTTTLAATQIADADTDDPPNTLAADFSWSFTVATPTSSARIHEIQGAAQVSPLTGMTVSGVPGIVTAKLLNGFFMQDPSADTDPATSEGIFVFTSQVPSIVVGDSVLVTGVVNEFLPGGAATNLSRTEIGSPTVSVVTTGNALPAPTVIGFGGRTPPTATIEDDSFAVFDPGSDAIDFYESLEGMLVRINDPVVVGPTNSFNEIPVLPDNGSWAGPRTPRGGIRYGSYEDGNPERIILDDVIVPFSFTVNVGDHFAGSVVGVMDYNFGNFMVDLTQAPTAVSGGLTRETTGAPGVTDLAVATFNVENLDAGDPPSKFNTLASLIVNNLRSPDLIAVEEVQDNNGAVDNGVVDASQTIGKLISAIKAAGGPTYDWREIDPVNKQDGGEPGGNIRQIFLFHSGGGLSFIDRSGGTSTTATSVVTAPDGSPQLSFSPGRIDPSSGAWSSSRKPLAGEFSYYDRHLFVIANHFNSKGGDQPLLGSAQPPTRSSETQRWQQAEIVNDFVDHILAIDGDAQVIVLGDLNDFEFSDTITKLKGTPPILADLIETLPPNERYTYDFEGNSQTLDHILVSGSLAAASELDVVHVNAEFEDATRGSDHDPQVVLIHDLTPPTIEPNLPPTNPNGWYGGNVGPTITFSCSDNIPVGLTCPPGITLAEGADQSVSGTATDAAGNTAMAVVPGLDVDLTKPTITFAGNLGAYTVDQTVAITCVATDGLSLIDADHTTCPGASGPAYTFAVGFNTLNATAADRAGNVASASTAFTVGVNESSLCTLVRRFVSKDGVATSLCAKLDSAAAARERGHLTVERNVLNAFANEVSAQRGKSITIDSANVLMELAARI